MEERNARKTLSVTLEAERRQREAVEGKLKSMEASLRAQQRRAEKLHQYEKIVGNLMTVRAAVAGCALALPRSWSHRLWLRSH